jgi:hypothetical protein
LTILTIPTIIYRDNSYCPLYHSTGEYIAVGVYIRDYCTVWGCFD